MNVMERAAVDSLELEYELQGSGEPVVLIHWGVSATWAEPLLGEPALSDGFRLLSYHRAGFGGSSPGFMPVMHRAALRVVLALRADHPDDLLFQQLGQHPEPDPDAQGEQPFLRRADQLPERLLHARRQRQLLVSDLIPRLRSSRRFLLSRSTTSVLATVATRPDEAGGPPPQVLRATGQPPFSPRR